jgi:maleylpyruvate isomerase
MPPTPVRADLPELVSEAERAQRDLEVTVAALDDDAARAPSLLPGWTRGHVLAHLARNAESHVRLLEAASRGETVEQYEGGVEGRAAAIDAGARRDARELIDDVSAMAQRLAKTWRSLSDEVWDRTVASNLGPRPAWRLVWSRWREVEIHHVDLNLAFRPADWPVEFVHRMLDATTTGLRGPLVTGGTVELVSADDGTRWTIGDPGSPRLAAVLGPAASILAWILGRGASMSDLTATDLGGKPVSLPPLAPWA